MSEPVVVSQVKASAYQDSVTLLLLARALRAHPGVLEVASLMGTPSNRDLLQQAGLLTAEAGTAGPNDLVIAIRAETHAAAAAALVQAETFLGARQQRLGDAGRHLPRTLERARRQSPDANLALISVPGPFAAREARQALILGLHVMLFSDNVSLEDEVSLKRLAARKGLFLMGPDCGTAIVNGVPLGFANAVPRGRVGFVSASGTGLQQVTTLLATQGEGVSQAIGVGGRDLSEAVGGLMTLQAVDALAADPASEVLVVIGKPPAPGVRRTVEARVHACGKPCVLALLGADVRGERAGLVHTVTNLEDAAGAALALLKGGRFAPRSFEMGVSEVRARVQAMSRALRPEQRTICGLYAGGTLAHEATLLLAKLSDAASAHRIVDLGADEYTVGRAHPMLDATLRASEIRKAGEEPHIGVLLLDIVLGYGAAVDPVGDVAPAIEAAQASARAAGRGLAVVASVVGTAQDPQGLTAQVGRLEAAGAWVLPSNAQAVRAAACIVGGEPVVGRLFATGDA